MRYKLSPYDVYNFDQTAILLNPHAQGGKTRATIGSKQVPLQGIDDKRQFTLVPVINAAGEKLPLQIIFKGVEGKRGAIPDKQVRLEFPAWHFTQTKNHWSNERTNMDLIEKIILPHARESKQTRRDLGEDVCEEIVIVLDCWPVQKTDSFRKAVSNLHGGKTILLYVPPNLTGQFQPLDVAVNSSLEAKFMKSYGMWAQNYVLQQAREQRKAGVSYEEAFRNVKLMDSTRAQKCDMCHWLSDAWDRVSTAEVTKAWEKAGLLRAWDDDFQKRL
jgi:hypothetical protein